MIPYLESYDSFIIVWGIADNISEVSVKRKKDSIEFLSFKNDVEVA
jgi:hypothetical protein